MRRYVLCKMTEDLEGLVVVFKGSARACNEYARANGYNWRRSQNLFGGYWVNRDGQCLFVHVAPTRSKVSR